MLARDKSQQPSVPMVLGSQFLGFLRKSMHAWIREIYGLRVGLGQNGQILFISVEQLSLNVADDSAKTLSVLENMGDALDDCLLRFLQMCRRPPQKYPRFWGSKKGQKSILKNSRAYNPTEIIPNR